MKAEITHPDSVQILTKHIFQPLSLNAADINSLAGALEPASLADYNRPFNMGALSPFIKEIRILKNLPAAIFNYCRAFRPESNLTPRQTEMLRSIANYENRSASYITDEGQTKKYIELLSLIRPSTSDFLSLTRIGCDYDGGYIFHDPGTSGVAYSFGVSSHSPWDFEMGERGYLVFQFDGTIKTAPDAHPNLKFFPTNIVAVETPKANEKNIAQIFKELKHENENDIILQIDIEGNELDFFENIEPEELNKFSQIIAEFHYLGRPEIVDRTIEILKKINRSHTSIHVHYNNCCGIIVCRNFLMSPILEVSFIRKDNHKFSPSEIEYPTNKDFPNVRDRPDIYIGKFSEIL